MLLLIVSLMCLAGSAILLFAAFRLSNGNRRDLRILNAHRIGALSAIQKSRMDLMEVRQPRPVAGRNGVRRRDRSRESPQSHRQHHVWPD